jgi:hypothetical protein
LLFSTALFLAFSAVTFYEERDALGRVSRDQIGRDGNPGRFSFEVVFEMLLAVKVL